MQVVGYARVSTREQAVNSHALEQQIERLKRAGAETIIVEVESGSKDSRVKFNELISLASQGLVKEIVVTRLDRLTRSLVTLRKTIDELAKFKVNLRALDDAIDTNSVAGRFQINMLGSLAEMEVDRLRERVGYGHQYKRDRNVPYHAPFGYKKVANSLELDCQPFLCLVQSRQTLSKADIGRDLIEIFLQYQSIRKAIQQMNSKYGLYYYAERGQGNRRCRGEFRFHTVGFSLWLKNPVLRGHLAYGRKRLDIRYNTHPNHQLMSDAEYEEIRNILKFNFQQKGFSFKSGVCHPLSGLIYCHECRRRLLCGNSLSNGVHYYVCQNYRERSCTQKRMAREDIIEEKIVTKLCDRAEQITEFALMPEKQSESPDLLKLRHELAFYESAPGDRSEFIKLELRRQIQMLEQQKSDYHQQELQTKLLEAFSDRAYYKTLKPEQKRDIYRGLVDRVWVREGQVVSVDLKL